MLTSYALMFCRITIACLFTFSFGSKALAFRNFVVTIADFKLLPRRWSKGVALLSLGTEIATALCIIIGNALLPAGFLLAITLLIVFSGALVITLKRKMSLSCNCFGQTDRPISRYDVARNGLLILCCLSGLWMLRYAQHDLTVGEITLLLLTGIVFLMFATNLSDVIETLLRPFPVSEERR